MHQLSQSSLSGAVNGTLQRMQAAESLPPIDMHAHIVGNGLRGSGCWLKVGVAHKALAAFMLHHIGVGVSTSAPEFDQAYAAHLAQLVQDSSLGAAVILAQDHVYDSQGSRLAFGSFYVPNDYVFQLARQYGVFLPACSIHPSRPDAMDELERCIEAGAVMLKLLPNCQNVDCTDKRHQKFWERMAAAKLPLLAHTGGEHTVPVYCKAYSDPATLRFPLECGVTIVAAHCATRSGLFDPEYFHTFVRMLEIHPNLYGDTSAFNVPVRGRHIRACLAEPLASRLVHGSDFPVPVFGHWACLQRFVNWRQFRQAEGIVNVIEKDAVLKRSMGFGPDHFTRVWNILRSTPILERLRANRLNHQTKKKTGPGSQEVTGQARGISN